MAINSANIKPYYGRICRGLNVFDMVEVNSHEIKKLFANYASMHLALHMSRNLSKENGEQQKTIIETFLHKYELPFQDQMRYLAYDYYNENFLSEYIGQDDYSDDLTPLTFLSIPKFEIIDNVLTFKHGILIIGKYLIPEGFKFTFDEDMEQRIKKLPKACLGYVIEDKIDMDIYECSDFAKDEGLKGMVELYNKLGCDEIVEYLKTLNSTDSFVKYESYFTIKAATFKLEDNEDYDFYFSQTIEYNHYNDKYDSYFIKWLNKEEKYAFLNIERFMEDERYFEQESNESDIFDPKTRIEYSDFIDSMIQLKAITE